MNDVSVARFFVVLAVVWALVEKIVIQSEVGVAIAVGVACLAYLRLLECRIVQTERRLASLHNLRLLNNEYYSDVSRNP